MTNTLNKTNTKLFFIDHIEPDFKLNNGTMILFCLPQEKGCSKKLVKFKVSPNVVHEDIVHDVALEMDWKYVHGSLEGLHDGLFIRVSNDVIGTTALEETQFLIEE